MLFLILLVPMFLVNVPDNSPTPAVSNVVCNALNVPGECS